MEVSNNTNNYQMLSTQQKQTTQPLPQEPTNSNKDIYNATGGNAVRSDGEVKLTPQGQSNLTNAQESNAAEQQVASEAQKSSQRETATNFLANQSKKSQVEIYLSVATDSKAEVGSNGDTVSILESLRDVQKQNNAVAAYATYQENQNPTKIAQF